MKLFQATLRTLSVTFFLTVFVSTVLLVNIDPSYLPIHYPSLWGILFFTIILWVGWEKSGGITGFVLVFLLTLYISLVTGKGQYLLANIPASIVLLLLINSQYKVKSSITNEKLKLDYLERTYNILLQEYNKKKVLRDSYHKKMERFTYLSHVARESGFSLAPQEINRLIMNNIIKTIDSGDIYSLWEVGEDLKTLHLQILESPKGIISNKVIESDQFNTWTMRNSQSLLISDIAKDYRFNTQQIITKTMTKSLMITPLLTNNKLLGIIRIDSLNPETFLLDDLRLLTIVGNLAALTIYNARLFKKIEHMANRDGLTNLYVRRYFNEYVENIIENSTNSGEAFSILLLDLDHFKIFNDTYGHSVGDRVLTKISKIIESCLATSHTEAIAARYGGEEFIVALNHTTKQKAYLIAEDIRQTVENETFSVRRKGVRTTISIGISDFPVCGNTLNTIIDKADKALYQAKHKGRNTTIVAE